MKQIKLEQVQEKIKEYERCFGKTIVSIVLYSDLSGRVDYSNWNGMERIKKEIFSFNEIKEFLESNPLEIAKESGFIRVMDK